VVLHGGLGSGATPYGRQFFDPDVYRFVLFDQRGCGRSTPLASEDLAALEHNTTADLIHDLELLRGLLGIEDRLSTLSGRVEPSPRTLDPVRRLDIARLVTHYFSNVAFLDDDAIVGRLDRIAHVPAYLLRGRLDIASTGRLRAALDRFAEDQTTKS
jgi:hypothetical protein